MLFQFLRCFFLLSLIRRLTICSLVSVVQTCALPISGVPTCYTAFDLVTAGLQPSDLLILAARPAMGNTSLALNIAEYATLKTRKACVVFSMEMSAPQLVFRLISSIGRINQQRLRTGQLEIGRAHV